MIKRQINWYVIICLLLIPSWVNATVLSDAAAKLSPGQWVSFSVNGFNNGAVFQVSCFGGTSLFQYTDKANWLPTAGVASIIGGIHMDALGPSCIGAKNIRYTESTNTFDEAAGHVPCCDDTWWPQGYYSDGHDYHNNTSSTVTGDTYHAQNSSGKVMRWQASSNSWSQCSVAAAGQAWGFQVTQALEYFPNRNSLILMNNQGGMWELPLVNGDCTGTWVLRGSGYNGGFSPQLTDNSNPVNMSLYNNQSKYSSRCNCIVFGGNNKLMRYNSNGTFSAVNMTGAPGLIGVPGSPTQGTIFTVDPATGMILLWSGNNAAQGYYQYDPLNDTWTFVTNSSPFFSAGDIFERVAIPISTCIGGTCNVIMFIQSSYGGGTGSVYLFKAGAGTPDTTPPSNVSGLVTTAAGSAQINLSWTAATDNVGVAGYNVYRCQGAGCTPTVQVATPSGTTFNDTGLSASTAYVYCVRARDGAGNLSAACSNTSGATTTAPDTQAPSVPTGLTLNVISGNQINLSWNASTDNVAVAGYNVLRCTGNSCTPTTQVYTPSGTTQSDTGLTGSTVYGYCVQARDAAPNTSACSTPTIYGLTPVFVGPTLTPTPTATSPGATVNVAFANIASPTNRDWIGLYPVGAPDTFNAAYPWFYTYGSPNCVTPSPPGGSTAQTSGSCNFTMPATTGNYNFRLFSNDADTNPLVVSSTVTSAAVVDTQAPTPPTGLTATAINTNVQLNWSASSDNFGVTGYRVERSPAGCAAFAQVYTPTGTSQIDSGLAEKTTYCYRVRATDAAGNLSGYSTPIAQATTGTAPAGSDFTTRCAQPGVLRCFSFDTDTDFQGNSAGGSTGAGYPNAWGLNYGFMPNSAIVAPARDTAMKVSGTSSLKFTIASMSGADNGSWFTNFMPDLSQQLGEGDEIWIQWRQRFSPEVLSTTYWAEGSGGADITLGATSGDGVTVTSVPALFGSCSNSTCVGHHIYFNLGADKSGSTGYATIVSVQSSTQATININISTPFNRLTYGPNTDCTPQCSTFRFDNGVTSYKFIDISAGDLAGQCSQPGQHSQICPTSCWDFEIVMQEEFGPTGVPSMYASCGGPYAYNHMYGSTSNITVQPAINGCLYPQPYPVPPCFKVQASEWMTFKAHIRVGTWNTWSSVIQMWAAHEGQPPGLIVDCGPQGTAAGHPCGPGYADNGWYLFNSNFTFKLGKVYLLPYMTGKSGTQPHSEGYVWYDDLIISKNDIADPGAGTVTPPTAATAVRVSQSY